MAEGNDITIENRLHQAWQQEWRWYCIRGASRFVVWLIALLAIDFIIDWGLFAKAGMSGNIGVVLLLVNIGVLGWVLWHEWLRYLKPYNPVTTSLEVEKRHPGLTSLLISYTQLKDGAKDQPNVSQALIEAMRTQAIERSRPLDFKEIVDFGQLKKLLGVCGGVLLVFAILSIGWSEHVGTLFKRLAGGNAEYPTQTVVEKVTGDLTIRIGSDATITASALQDHVVPGEGRLFFKEAGSEDKWKEAPMKATEGAANVFSRELKGLTKDQLFYVRLGDDRSEEHRIHVISAPQITSINLALKYPKYMDKADEKNDQLNLEVREGTTIQWTLACDPPVDRWQVIVPIDWGVEEEPESEAIKKISKVAAEKDKPKFRYLEADLDEAGTTATFELPIESALKYSFKWVEKANGFQYEDVQYSVKVTTDGLPDIDLLAPKEVGYATVDKVVEIEAKATDDIGLSKAWLVYSVNGADEAKIEIQDLTGETNKEFKYTWKLADQISELKATDRVSFALEVVDRHPDQADHTRRTPTRQMTIVTTETYLDWYRTEYSAQIEELKRSRNQELAAEKAVQQLKTEEGIETKNEEDKDENDENK